MTEMQLVYMFLARAVILVAMCFIYTRAGRGWKLPWLGKVRRRVYLPAILCSAWVVVSLIQGSLSLMLFLLVLGTFGIYYGTMSIGYGANSWIRKTLGKVPQQYIVGALQGGSCVLIAYYTQRWGLYSLCVLVPSLTLGALGSWADGDVPAALKEGLICVSIFVYALFLV